MIWLWQQLKDFAFGAGLLFWAWVAMQAAAHLFEDPRSFARRACGIGAGFSAILAVLWACHLADKYL